MNQPNIFISLLEHWAIPPVLQDKLDRYYLLQWDKNYFLSTENQTNKLHHQGIEYCVFYFQTIRMTLNNPAVKRVALSFRKLPSMPYGYVLVKPLYE